MTLTPGVAELERLVLDAPSPMLVSVAADDVVLEQNAELRSCFEGRLVARRKIDLGDGESEFVGFYELPSDAGSRHAVLKWFWSAEQLRLLACWASPAFVETLSEEMLLELASGSDRRMSLEKLAHSLRLCKWAAFHDHSDRADALSIVGI